MAILLFANPDQQRADESKVLWLLEDIWVYSKGDAELQLECVIESQTKVKKAFILMSHYVERIDDLNYLYEDTSFQYGYPLCWPDVYHSFEIRSSGRISINGIEAKVASIKAELKERASRYSEIDVEFTPPISDRGVFRIGMLCKGFVNVGKGILPWREKHMSVYTYGIAPHTGTVLDSLLTERRLPQSTWLQVDKHTLYVKLWEKEPVFTSCTKPPSTSYPFTECFFVHRYCPPLERMAPLEGKEVPELRKRNSYCMAWELEQVLPSGGQLINVSYFSSRAQKWITEHWIALLACTIAMASLTIGLLRLARG